MSWLDRFLFRGKKRPGQWRPVQESRGDVAVGDGAVLNVSSNSYRSLIEAAVSDAERIAADITDKARNDANAEAARVIAQARLAAEELKGKAEASAREEAANIISEAEQTADSIEIAAKKRAVQFLVQQSQIIEKEIAREYRLALAKLSANLQSLSSDSDKMNVQLKRKMAMLAANKSLALNEAKNALLETAKTEAAPLDTPAEKGRQLPSGVDPKTNRAIAAGKQGKKLSRKKLASPTQRPPEAVIEPGDAFKPEPAIPAAALEPSVIAATDPAPAAAQQTPVEQKPVEAASSIAKAAPEKKRNFFSFSFSLPGKKAKPAPDAPKHAPEPAAVKEEPAPPEDVVPSAPVQVSPETPKPPAAEIPVEAPPEPVKPPAATARVEAPELKPEEPPKAEPDAPAVVAQTAVESPTLLEVDTQLQYSGEVELMIVPPVDLKLVTQLYNYLQTIPELKVLYTRGSWDQGTTIVVVLEKPFALVKSITGMPNASVSIGVLEKDAAAGGKTMSLLRRKDRVAKRLGLILKEPVAEPKP